MSIVRCTHFSILFVFALLARISGAQTVEWTRQLGNDSVVESQSVSVDGLGNVYISGRTDGDLGDVDGQWHWYDAFVSKYDTEGILEWTQQLGSTEGWSGRAGWDESSSISIDGLGNVYISGRTGGDLGGVNAGANDAFVSKYDTDGTLEWTQQLGTSRQDRSYGVSVDRLGSVFISGKTGGDLGGANAGSSDAFVSKYDTDGTLEWTRQLGSSGQDESYGVSTDGLGNVYISGSTNGDLGGANAGSYDAFVSKYDTDGTLEWTQQLGTSGWDESRGVSADGLGNVFISGVTRGDLGSANTGSYDTFVSKFDAAGVLEWTRQLGSRGWDYSYGISADGQGDVFISGYTEGALDGINDGYREDAFVSKYDTNGILVWTRQIGTSEWDQSRGVFADGLGNVFISGVTTGNFEGLGVGLLDSFVIKLNDLTFVPEPTSGVLLFTTLVGLASRRRR